MILPLWGQGCIVTYQGERTLGEAQGFLVNQDGCYRIKVWSRRWGYDLTFKPADVELLPVELANGEKYDAVIAFSKHFSAAQISTMAGAEREQVPSAARQRLQSVAKPATKAVAAPTVARRVMRGGRSG